jgi:protein-S-isoprenylcysteine O-methyltransferase Ste14
MMDGESKKENILEEILRCTVVHRVLAHSYFVYLFFLLIGVVLDVVFHIHAFEDVFVIPAGIILIVLATALIFWAQHTSRNLSTGNISKEAFLHGPYCYTRSPTHYGLFLLMLGFGFVANAFFVIMFTIISLLVTKFFFLKKEESLLEEKYGEPYKAYKKIVKF